jgi:hypothetical protein
LVFCSDKLMWSDLNISGKEDFRDDIILLNYSVVQLFYVQNLAP